MLTPADPARAADPAGAAGAGAAGAGSAVQRLVRVMDALRERCPWDAQQTHESLAPYLLEETYEALDAIEQADLAELRGELGDVLLQVVFHARVASERTDGTGFTIDDVANGIADKLVRRHPHVFGSVTVSGAGEVRSNWAAIKAQERAEAAAAAGGGPVSALDGVPMGQPALSLAAQLLRRAEAAGAPPGLADLPVTGEAPVAAPVGPVAPAALAAADPPAGPVSAIGAGLFALAGKARAAGLDPELELRRAARAYRDRVVEWERGQAG